MPLLEEVLTLTKNKIFVSIEIKEKEDRVV